MATQDQPPATEELRSATVGALESIMELVAEIHQRHPDVTLRDVLGQMERTMLAAWSPPTKGKLAEIAALALYAWIVLETEQHDRSELGGG